MGESVGMRIFLRAAVLSCAACVWQTAAAQSPPAPPERQGGQRPAVTQKTVTPPAPPAPTPSAAPARKGEPFDGAGREALAAQCVRLETEAGVIELEMLPEGAPETVRNFLNLAAAGAFDSTAFSRVVPGFIVQGGNLRTHQNLTAELAERARRTIPDEPNAVRHVRGVVSMARPETPNSATTGFFILVADGAHLDGKFAAFARVRAGLEVADRINGAPVEGERPVNPVRVKRATVAPCAAGAEKPDPKDPARG